MYLSALFNILKRKCADYEANRNKMLGRKYKNNSNQETNEGVYEWFVAQRVRNMSISGLIIQKYRDKNLLLIISDVY